MKPVIAVTIGDFNGIGPEVALKASAHPAVRRICTPLIVGPFSVLEHVRSALRLRAGLQKASAALASSGGIHVIDVGDGIWADVQYGQPSKASGKSAGIAIERAVSMCMAGKAHGMVTAPGSKEGLNLAGYNFPGQTEMIALLSRSQRFAMMLISKELKVGLVTIHAPLRSVPEMISKEKIVEKGQVVNDCLKRDFQIKNPKIAVLALNPHAGEQGILGQEEITNIKPAIQELQKRGVNADGPFPADGFLGNRNYRHFDAILAMYHDQGLIPLKMSSFGKAVNYSAGLNLIRTSPDHGTAYDIAGKGKARIDSMVEAIKLAVRFAEVRRHD